MKTLLVISLASVVAYFVGVESVVHCPYIKDKLLFGISSACCGKDGTKVRPHLPGKNCTCGCVEGGQCTCKDCDHPVGKDPTPPVPNCQCGCTKTGKCTCKDCDHPKID